MQLQARLISLSFRRFLFSSGRLYTKLTLQITACLGLALRKACRPCQRLTILTKSSKLFLETISRENSTVVARIEMCNIRRLIKQWVSVKGHGNLIVRFIPIISAYAMHGPIFLANIVSKGTQD